MKKVFIVAMIMFLGIGRMDAQYPLVTITQIQKQPLDSLKLADSLQSIASTRWALQASPLMDDTVTVVALCVVPPKTMTFTQRGYSMLLYDTASTATTWKGLFVRTSNDTTTHIGDGFLNVKRGYLIGMTGVVSEFPAGLYNSVTQFQPIPGIPIVVLDTGLVIPPPVQLTLGDFYKGKFPGGKVNFSVGEQYESMMVQFTDASVDAKVNTTRGTFSMVDEVGNQITEYDASKFFTLAGGTTDHSGPDSIWQIKYAELGVGTRVDTLRGLISTVSGSENPRGFRVSPIYYGDLKFGVVAPALFTHRRNPVVVSSDSAARISVVARRQPLGAQLASVTLRYSVDNGAWQSLAMVLSDTTYKASIPKQPENTFVRYFIQAIDSADVSAILASSAVGAFSSDTLKGFFFYTVLNRPLAIRDVQYTPFLNGRSPYLGATVTVSGVVTADTASLGRSPLNTAGTNTWYLQSGNQPWNGIWFDDTLRVLLTLTNGDSITITGNVAEDFDVTQITNLTGPLIVHSTGVALPSPVTVTTGTFGPTVGNGNPAAEQWEGMLVRLNNVQVKDIAPTFADNTEFSVDDGTGPILVRRDGRHSYSNVVADTITGKTILRVDDRISYLTGIMYFSFNRYKITPRTNSDFGTITGVGPEEPILPASYVLNQNYPNPFNPSTVIRYALPEGGPVSLKVYNLLGQEVQTLVDGMEAAGTHTVVFNARSLASGIYFYRLTSHSFTEVKKMMLMK
jgi:hypothetical protein